MPIPTVVKALQTSLFQSGNAFALSQQGIGMVAQFTLRLVQVPNDAGNNRSERKQVLLCVPQ